MCLYLFLVLSFLITTFAKTNTQPQLFAGNGLKTYTYTMYNGILEMNCSTYNDCYNFLCMPVMPDDYLMIIKPNYWSGNCKQLNDMNNNTFNAGLNIVYDNKIYKWYDVYNISQASLLLCKLNKHSNITRIEYYGISC